MISTQLPFFTQLVSNTGCHAEFFAISASLRFNVFRYYQFRFDYGVTGLVFLSNLLTDLNSPEYQQIGMLSISSTDIAVHFSPFSQCLCKKGYNFKLIPLDILTGNSIHISKST
jgi:hypothetical protein